MVSGLAIQATGDLDSRSRHPDTNPNAAIDLLKLTSGHLLMVYTDSSHERTPLTVAYLN